MTEPNTWPALLQQLESGETIAPADFLMEVRRIANALEAISGRKNGCYGENPSTGQVCVLDEGHVGYHMPGDGREPWLDA